MGENLHQHLFRWSRQAFAALRTKDYRLPGELHATFRVNRFGVHAFEWNPYQDSGYGFTFSFPKRIRTLDHRDFLSPEGRAVFQHPPFANLSETVRRDLEAHERPHPVPLDHSWTARSSLSAKIALNVDFSRAPEIALHPNAHVYLNGLCGWMRRFSEVNDRLTEIVVPAPGTYYLPLIYHGLKFAHRDDLPVVMDSGNYRAPFRDESFAPHAPKWMNLDGSDFELVLEPGQRVTFTATIVPDEHFPTSKRGLEKWQFATAPADHDARHFSRLFSSPRAMPRCGQPDAWIHSSCQNVAKFGVFWTATTVDQTE